ncbi:MAG: DUF3857 domain-containing protein [Agriterribacter sp.]
MRAIFLTITTVLFCILQNDLVAQRKPTAKYGKISPTDFSLSKYKFDTSAAAVVIADVGLSEFDGNPRSGFHLYYTKYSRIKILNKNGLGVATISIPLYYTRNGEENLTDLKASTYSLQRGEVVETALDKKSIFKDRYDENHLIVKFTLPAVKEGSIIEYSYTINSDFIFNLQPWRFQGEYPVLWSEYEVRIPEYFQYAFLSQGTFPLEHSYEPSKQSISLANSKSNFPSTFGTISMDIENHKWIAKNVPVLKEESFTSTLNNHVSKIEFQLAQVHSEDGSVKNYLGSWTSLATDLMKDESFGASLQKNNNWLDEELKPVIQNTMDTLEKAKKIFALVRDQFACTDVKGIYLSTPIKTVDKNKNGDIADINILLVTMMKHANINAYPILLSTRSHGYTNELYPLLNRFNYVICGVDIADKTYYLDATDPLLGFNRLLNECYNGHARAIFPDTTKAVYLNADSLIVKKITTVLIQGNKPGEWAGHFTTNMGYYESFETREKIKEAGEETFFKTVQSAYNNEVEIKEKKIEGLKDLDESLKVEYDFNIHENDDIVYFNPMMNEGYKDNFFKAAERLYPVEMPYPIDETYVLNFEIPDNYVVEDLPKPAKINLGEKSGFFEYIIDKSDGTVRLRSRLKLNRANYFPQEYNDLREFFSYVVKKHAEPIVLKKKQ